MEHDESQGHRLGLEGGLDRRRELLRVDVVGKRLVRQRVAHRPGGVLVQQAHDRNRLVERRVLSLGQGYAALVAVEHRGPGHTCVGGDVDSSVLSVEDPPR